MIIVFNFKKLIYVNLDHVVIRVNHVVTLVGLRDQEFHNVYDQSQGGKKLAHRQGVSLILPTKLR